MQGRNKILILFIWLLTACATVNVPTPYQFKNSELKTQPYGCWINMTLHATPGHPLQETAAGELLFMDDTITKVLVFDGEVKTFPTNTIARAELFTHKNQAGNYFLVSMLLAIPSMVGMLAHGGEYAGYFLLTALPITAAGTFYTFLEGRNVSNILRYPEKNVLSQFVRFARFPVSWPENINTQHLKLKVLNYPD